VGAAEYFQTPLMARLARFANIVPVDADANLVSAMKAAAAGLRLGKILILFPEGERTIDGSIKPFRKGAAILASHLELPIVPVGLSGLFALWPRGRRIDWRLLRPWRRPVVSIGFGAPLRVTTTDYDQASRVLQDRVMTAAGSQDPDSRKR
jgi:long-chain acyl-CoA synthetase